MKRKPKNSSLRRKMAKIVSESRELDIQMERLLRSIRGYVQIIDKMIPPEKPPK